MAVSAFPALVDALVAAADASPALAAVLVLDGEGVTEEPGDYLMIGSNNADESGGAAAGESAQEWAGVGGLARDEEGDISCLAVSWNGDGDPKRARDNAYSIVETVAALCRANPSLGVEQVLWTSFGTRTLVQQAQTEAGAACLVEFTVHYRARL